MTEQDRCSKFWRTLAEKAADVQKEYDRLSDAEKRRVDRVVQGTLKTCSVAGFAELVSNPPQFRGRR